MNSYTTGLPSLLLALGWLSTTSVMSAAETKATPEANKQLVQASFDRWRTGTGGPFELLAPEAIWTITGNSLVAKKYGTRDEFIEAVIKPFNARMTKPLSPSIKKLYVDGDNVIAHFDAEAVARDGKPYRNTYAWFMEMKDGKIVNVTAFFDSIAFDELWKRVPANP